MGHALRKYWTFSGLITTQNGAGKRKFRGWVLKVSDTVRKNFATPKPFEFELLGETRERNGCRAVKYGRAFLLQKVCRRGKQPGNRQELERMRENGLF